MADVPHFLLLLTAREDHTWFDHLAAGNKLGSMSPAPLPGGWRRRVPAGHRRRCWQRQNWLKWRHFIPALTETNSTGRWPVPEAQRYGRY